MDWETAEPCARPRAGDIGPGATYRPMGLLLANGILECHACRRPVAREARPFGSEEKVREDVQCPMCLFLTHVGGWAEGFHVRTAVNGSRQLFAQDDELPLELALLP